MANIIKNGRVSQRDRPLSNEKTISYGKDIKNDRISQHGPLENIINYEYYSVTNIRLFFDNDVFDP